MGLSKPEEKARALGWCAGTPGLRQGKHGVSALLKSLHDAIDGNDNGGLAILEAKRMQKKKKKKACHKSSYLSELDECENMHWSRHIKFFPLCRRDKKCINVSLSDEMSFK